MTKKVFILLIGILFISSSAYAIEERFEDVVATVVVGSVFKLSIDNDHLDFGLIKPGKTVQLYPGRHYNQVAAVSNNGNIWYLKMAVTSGIQGTKGDNIPNDRLKWRVTSVDGDGVAVGDWNSFTDGPVLVYVSGPQDTRGNEVKIYLQYALDVPADATSGNYQAAIFYTITESP